MKFNYLELAKRLQDLIHEEFHSDSDRYIDDEDGSIMNEEDLTDRAMEKLLEEVKEDMCEEAGEVLDEFIEHFKDGVYGYLKDDLLSDLEIAAREIHEEYTSFRRNPLGHHGLRQSDFL